MAQEQRPIKEVLFGAAGGDAVRTDADLAETISAWFRASRARLRGVRRQPPGGRRPSADAGADHRVEEEG
jgi:hypothetical protein